MAESAGYKRILVSDNEAHFQWPLWMNGIPHKSLLRIKVLIIDTSVGVILGWDRQGSDGVGAERFTFKMISNQLVHTINQRTI